MPKPERGTRSDAIREFLKTNPTAVTKDIITGLQAKGIDVSEALVHKIKSRDKKRTKIRQKAATTSVRKQKVAVSKSESIRTFLRQNPNATPTVVQTGLRKEGVKVSTGLISNVTFYFRKKKAAPRVTVAARKVRAKTTRATSAPAPGVSFDQLIEVKKVADALGGTSQVREALDMLEQLR